MQGWNDRYFVLSQGRMTYFKSDKVVIRSLYTKAKVCFTRKCTDIAPVFYLLANMAYVSIHVHMYYVHQQLLLLINLQCVHRATHLGAFIFNSYCVFVYSF